MDELLPKMNLNLQFSFMSLASHKDMSVFTDLLPVMKLVLEVQNKSPQQQEFLGFVLERMPQEANSS